MSRRVLIADDDALARAALRTIFDAHDDLDPRCRDVAWPC